jgi:hypothetical protein
MIHRHQRIALRLVPLSANSVEPLGLFRFNHQVWNRTTTENQFAETDFRLPAGMLYARKVASNSDNARRGAARQLLLLIPVSY